MSNIIEVIRRTDVTINVTVKDNDGVAINITGYSVYFTVKESYLETDANALIAKTVTSHTTPASGITAVTLTDADTDLNEGTYFYDFMLVDGSGYIRKTKRGSFNVVHDVRRGV